MTTAKRKIGFAGNSALVALRQVAGVAIGFAATVVTARYLGAAGQGTYALALLLPTLLATCMTCGIDAATVFYTGKDAYKPATVYKTNLVSAFALSALSLLIGCLVVLLFGRELFAGATRLQLLLALAAVPQLLFGTLLGGILQGMQDFKRLAGAAFASQLLGLALLLAATAWLHWGVAGAIAAYAGGQCALFLLVLAAIRRVYGLRMKDGSVDRKLMKQSFIYGGKEHVSNMLTFLNYRADLFMIAFFIGSSAAGVYTITVAVAEQLWFVSRAVSLVLFPRISAAGGDAERNLLTSAVGRIVLALTLAFAVVTAVLAKPFIGFAFGHEFAAGGLALQLLLPGIVAGSLERVLSHDISGRGKPEISMYVSMVTVVCNLALNVLLVPKYGIAGAAAATSTAYIVSFAVKIVIFRRLTGLRYHEFMVVQREDWQKAAGFIRSRVRPALNRS
ncbi:MAG: polysaccharide biosynthesis C-terminal domain-containing protein [Paenibacillaceae bacterium]|nr:polysaccharide biosynthesis C-terminal domain-containing protein [Paenibacillaceae bacterium]